MNELNDMIENLKRAHEEYYKTKNKELEVQKEIIQEETIYLMNFIEKIYSFSKKKVIHEVEALLLFVYPTSEKTLISPEVYIKPNGEIVYEVFDEEKYLAFRPHAEIRDKYNIISIEEFLGYVSLPQIIEFFDERSDVLDEYAAEMKEKNVKRHEFLLQFKQHFKD